jgi:hypothetical protein
MCTRTPFDAEDVTALLALVIGSSVISVAAAHQLEGELGMVFFIVVSSTAMGALCWLAQLLLRRTTLSLDDEALHVRSGILGARGLRRIARGEIVAVHAHEDAVWRVGALLRDGSFVAIAELAYATQAAAVCSALRDALDLDTRADPRRGCAMSAGCRCATDA